MWHLQGIVTGRKVIDEKWATQEGAIARRDFLLRSQVVRDGSAVGGYRTIVHSGWTAITGVRQR